MEPVDTVKLLGVTLDPHFTMGPAIENISKKCHGLIGMLRRAAPYLSQDLLKLAYCSLIRTHLKYCSAVLAPAAKSHLAKLDVIQKMAARVIMGAPSQAHSAPLLNALKLDSLQSRRDQHVTNLVDSFTHGRCHPHFEKFFSLANDLVASTDQRRPRIAIGRKCFSVYGPNVVNSRRTSAAGNLT